LRRIGGRKKILGNSHDIQMSDVLFFVLVEISKFFFAVSIIALTGWNWHKIVIVRLGSSITADRYNSRVALGFPFLSDKLHIG